MISPHHSRLHVDQPTRCSSDLTTPGVGQVATGIPVTDPTTQVSGRVATGIPVTDPHDARRLAGGHWNTFDPTMPGVWQVATGIPVTLTPQRQVSCR